MKLKNKLITTCLTAAGLLAIATFVSVEQKTFAQAPTDPAAHAAHLAAASGQPAGQAGGQSVEEQLAEQRARIEHLEAIIQQQSTPAAPGAMPRGGGNPPRVRTMPGMGSGGNPAQETAGMNMRGGTQGGPRGGSAVADQMAELRAKMQRLEATVQQESWSGSSAYRANPGRGNPPGMGAGKSPMGGGMAGMGGNSQAGAKPGMGGSAMPASGGMGMKDEMMGKMDNMMGMMGKMMGGMGGGAPGGGMGAKPPMGGGAMPANGGMPMMDDDKDEMAMMMDKMNNMMGMMGKMMGGMGGGAPGGMGGGGMGMGMKDNMMGGMGGAGMPAGAPPAGMSGGGDMGMGMDKMEMAGMMGMSGMGGGAGAAMPRSALPGFPGASHLYHIGATDFFLDHPQHIALSIEQTAGLNQAKEQAALDRVSTHRSVQEAEQDLWTLTASDQPDNGLIEAKVANIEKLQGDGRLRFIGAVGEASKLLTDQQRSVLTGFALPAPAAPMAAPPTAMAPMKDM